MEKCELNEISSVADMYRHYQEATGCGEVAAALLALAEVVRRAPFDLASSIENGLSAASPLSVRVSGDGLESRLKEGAGAKGAVDPDSVSSPNHVPPAVAAWMKRNDLGQHHLEEVFHVDEGKVTVIASSVPGTTKKEQTVNCYVLEGIRAFLQTGSAKFADADADTLCQRIGCRDRTNHAANRASAGNKLTGSRKDGFTLVAPGLIYAAKLIREIADIETDARA